MGEALIFAISEISFFLCKLLLTPMSAKSSLVKSKKSEPSTPLSTKAVRYCASAFPMPAMKSPTWSALHSLTLLTVAILALLRA